MCNWFLSEKELKSRGIAFEKFVQKPGDAVYSGYGCYHWVLNPVRQISQLLTLKNGGTHIAWNQVWLSQSIVDLLDSPIPLVRVPKEMLVYCAAKHFINDLPMAITRKDLERVSKRFSELQVEVLETEVRLLTSDVSGDVSLCVSGAFCL